MSVSDLFESDLFSKTTAHTIELSIRSQDLLEDIDHKLLDCDKTNHTGKCDVNGHLNGSHGCDIRPGKPKTNFSTGHLDSLANNTVWESEEGTRNCSLDFQTNRFGARLPKTDSTNRGKRKIEPLKGRRLLPVSPELEFVEEEDLSENEESSDEDNVDNTLHFRSKDGLDHKKGRHQYVSDKLDPDVLHLLEMHLRKQQLVDIKEEGEEELLDVHINKEKTRSDSYKLLRNISPVLDMVLEEPELEHAGDMLDEDSKTPSDIDSDDSSNVSAIEVGLMESLQYDLMSKSSKIDKNEIATILHSSNLDILSRNKSKQKEGSLYHSEWKSTNGNIQTKEPKISLAQTRDSGDLEVIQEDGYEDVGSDVVSEYVTDAAHDSANIQLLSESSALGSLPQQYGKFDETETTETLLEENILAKPGQVGQSSKVVTSLDQDLVSNVTQQTLLKAVTQTTHMEPLLVREDNSFHDSEIMLPGSVNTDNSSGSPCPTLNGDVKPPAYLESITSNVMKAIDNPDPKNESDFIIENDFSEQQDVVHTTLSDHLTNLNKDLKGLKDTVKSQTEPVLSETPLCSTADMDTLQTDLQQKILSLLEKAHAADCRSSHLQAEAELLFKESIELRNECKSLSKEATELLSMFTQQGLLHRHQTEQSIHKSKAEGSTCASETKPRTKSTLSYVSKRNSRNKKGESQLQMLSQKYDFLREEGPEIIRELHVLQQDLKNLPPRHSKPINVLYKWLWGGLIAGSAMFLVWWSAKQLV